MCIAEKAMEDRLALSLLTLLLTAFCTSTSAQVDRFDMRDMQSMPSIEVVDSQGIPIVRLPTHASRFGGIENEQPSEPSLSLPDFRGRPTPGGNSLWLRPGEPLVARVRLTSPFEQPVFNEPPPSEFGVRSDQQLDSARLCREAITAVEEYWSEVSGASPQSLWDFKNSCLLEIGALPDGIDANWDGKVDASVSILEHAIGVLMLNGVPLCTATLLDSKILVTARHCIWNADVGVSVADAIAVCASQHSGACSLTFARRGDTAPTNVVKFIVHKSPPGPVSRIEDDFVLLKLGQPLAVTVHVRLATPEVSTAFIIVGAPDSVTTIRPDGSVKWRHRLRISNPNVPCYLKKVEATRLLHTCQTWEAFSGSPLVMEAREEKGKPYLLVAGFHVGDEAIYSVHIDKTKRLGAAIFAEPVLKFATSAARDL